MAQKKKKQSNYGLALTEKQKIKYYYGIREAQLRRYFDNAKRMKGNTGEFLLVQCERRLDNVVRRAGFCSTRPQARQGVTHGHFHVNGKPVDIPSFQVKAGDVITVRNRPNLQARYAELAGSSGSQDVNWIQMDKENLRAIVTTLPTMQDVSLPVGIGQVVAFMSR